MNSIKRRAMAEQTVQIVQSGGYPGVDLTEDRLTLKEIAARYAPRTPRFSSPPLNEISESTEELIKKAKAEKQPGAQGITMDQSK